MSTIISKHGVIPVIGIDAVVAVEGPGFVLNTKTALVIRPPVDANYQINGVGEVGVMPANQAFGISEGVESITFDVAMNVEVMSR